MDWSFGPSTTADKTIGRLSWIKETETNHRHANTSTGYIDLDLEVPVVYSVTKNDTTTIKFYKDGAFSEDVTAAGNDNVFEIAALFSFYTFTQNDSNDANGGVRGRMQYQAHWMRDMPAGEHRAFHANPYALLKPRTPVLYHFQSEPPTPLDNDLISSMHFQRHYEPIPAMV